MVSVHGFAEAAKHAVGVIFSWVSGKGRKGIFKKQFHVFQLTSFLIYSFFLNLS
jgi:hypothetical protein